MQRFETAGIAATGMHCFSSNRLHIQFTFLARFIGHLDSGQWGGGGHRGRAVKSTVSKSLDHLTAMSGVGSSPALATCESSQVLLADVPGGFFLGVLPFSSHLLIGPSHMS